MTDMWQHWSEATQLPDPRAELFQLQDTLEKQCQHSQNLATLRARVCADIVQLQQDLLPETQLWWDALPTHVRSLYKSIEQAVQVPVIEHLARMFHWPDNDILAELSLGFPFLGRLTPGAGWPKREDGKYSNPRPIWDFLKFNQDYIHSKLKRHRVDDHWEVMLREIVEDVGKNRMQGPFEGPACWPNKMVGVPNFEQTENLQPGPLDHEPTSVAFSIQQTGSDGQPKVRRGEDWRRSGHNSTVLVDDGPVNHRPAKFLRAHGKTPWLWGTDQEAAYRQMPIEDPGVTWVILFTPSGPTLWRHRALLFGSVASVWAYGRVADLLCWLGRTLLLTGVLHFVDDYGAVECAETAESSFHYIHQLWECLGMTFKESKKQRPGPAHKIQGVMMSINADSFKLSPVPERTGRIRDQLKEILLRAELTDDEAQRLAGKLQFLSETMMGAAMKSCLQPLYVRACQPNVTHVTEALQDAIQTILHLLETQKPKLIPFDHKTPAVLYADAFFEAGDRKIKVGEACTADYDKSATNLMKNGWGFILRLPDGRTICGRGALPGHLMGRFTTNGAYIYALEILAQMMALIITQDILPEVVWAWIDNTAGQAALSKGYGRDRKINRLLAMLWAFLTEKNIEPFWRRVPSAANISDPISRNDLTLIREQSWTLLDEDWSPLYEKIMKGLSSMDAAMKTAKQLTKMGVQIPRCETMAAESHHYGTEPVKTQVVDSATIAAERPKRKLRTLGNAGVSS